MYSEISRAPSRAPAPARSSAALLESRLSRFNASVQPRVRALAAEHDWIADLAISFPAVLFALARPRVKVDSEAALALVISGAPLATVAQRAGVPIWLRNLPPEAFTAAIPALPDTAEFRRCVVNHVPNETKLVAKWLLAISNAAAIGDADIALWFARAFPLRLPRQQRWKRPYPRLVAFWAWHSIHADRERVPMRTIWRPEMQWDAAETGAIDWANDLSSALDFTEAIDDVWVEDAEINGYSFVAIRNRDDLYAEAIAMKHCVAKYAYDIADNRARVWSIRKDGEHVATLSAEVMRGPLPTIRELAGPSNAQVGLPIWIAARRFIVGGDHEGVDPQRYTRVRQGHDHKAWQTLWRPYWLAKRRIPAWLSLTGRPWMIYDAHT
ncbi:MAG: hypothetical protein NT015_13625 [Alphaproteobacteria bacterium]|nr:hypothetical protein [Alphaproteobacteria bacterium]